MKMNPAINDRVKYFDAPFAYVIMNQKVEDYCSFCLRRSATKLQLCGNCRFSRYCDKNCQRAAWRQDHKIECKRLKNVFPNLPVSEALFLARIVDKLIFIQRNGDVLNWQKERRFDDLLTHENEIRADRDKMAHFEKMYEKTARFMAEDTPPKEEFFLIFCRTWINSHSIHTSVGDEIGMALDLGVSRYDHCCRPNVTLVFNGFRAVLRPLAPDVDANNHRKAFIAYVDVGRSKYQRRKELQCKWYFWCQCERCLDPDDDRLTSMKCSHPDCKEPIIITEDCEIPDEKKCDKCNTVISKESMQKAQDLMKTIPSKFNFSSDPEEISHLKQLLEEAEPLLHAENIYYCRLMTAYMQMTGAKDAALTNAEMQKMVYQNYRRCLPKSDRHIGYQLLHLVKTLIEQNRREEATPYAYEAMTIFEVSFGLEHPYYLQTLALWTYLDTKAEKTDEQLFQLMNFNYNSPVDLSSLLAKAAVVD